MVALLLVEIVLSIECTSSYQLLLCVCNLIIGPGLAIRVICADEPYMEKDFAETSNMLKTIVDYSNAVKKVIISTE